MSSTKTLTVLLASPVVTATNLSESLKEAASKLTSISLEKDRTINILSLFLVSALTDDDKALLEINYWLNDKNYDKSLRESLEFNKEYKISNELSNMESFGTPSLTCQTFRLSQGDGQWDSIQLLEFTSKELLNTKTHSILDCIYHPYIDNDGIEHPYIRVYQISSTLKPVLA